MFDGLISIIVPIYNVEDYLPQCVESILNQTYQKIEVILVDDGSRDSSATIIDKYAEKDNRVIIVHKENGGLVSARKSGLQLAKGQYVVYVDGDDWIESNRIDNLVKNGLNRNPDMVYMNGYRMDYGYCTKIKRSNIDEGHYFGKESIREKIIYELSDSKHCFDNNVFPAMWMWAVKKNLMQEIQRKIPDSIRRGEDQMFNLACLLMANSVNVMKEDGYHYVQRKQSMIGSNLKIDKHWRHTTRKIISAQGDMDSQIERIVTFLTFSPIFSSEYRTLLCGCDSFLFPYKQVILGSKIIVYGAGNIGNQLVEYITEKKDYSLVAWVDSNPNLRHEKINGIEICSFDDVKNMEYDFIVIALFNYWDAHEVCNNLLQIGVEKGKIAVMDSSVITEEYLPEDYK